MLELFIPVLVLVHILGVVLSTGAATVADYLFVLNSQRDNINTETLKVLPDLARLVLLGFAVVIATGLALILITPEVLLLRSMQLKLVLTAIIFVTGVVLDLTFMTAVRRCIAEDTSDYLDKRVLRYSVLLGNVNVVSWYAILALSFLNPAKIPIPLFLLMYSSAIFMKVSFNYQARIPR